MSLACNELNTVTERREYSDGPPRIESVLDHTDGRADRLTPGGMFSITGRGFGIFEDVPLDVGVYVSGGSSSDLVRVHRYASWLDNEICGYWPNGMEGPIWLFMETHSEDGLILSAVHHRPLALRCAPAAPSRPA